VTEGKTIVSVSASHVGHRQFSNGVCCVDLGDVSDPSHVTSAVASAVGIAPTSRNLLPMLRGVLRTTELLLVLHNCEHVLEAAAALAKTLSNQDGSGHPEAVSIAQRTRTVALAANQHAR
jgi:predicted ATPase